MKKGLTSALVLLVLGTVAGLILAVVNYFTAPIIAGHELAEKLAAMEIFYPDIATAYDVEEIKLEGDIDTVYILTSKTSHLVVAAIYSVSSMGYKTSVDMLIAVNADLTVQGYSLIGNGGTEGLGLDYAGIDFGMAGQPVSDTTGSFDAYAGATITSNAIRTCFDLVAARAATDLGGA
jgi:Na+-translocating ferredoxin:NAD+ oxidoreductase RnfG subunit